VIATEVLFARFGSTRVPEPSEIWATSCRAPVVEWATSVVIVAPPPDPARRLPTAQVTGGCHRYCGRPAVVHTDGSGYGQLRRYATAAAKVVGVWVNVITDDARATQVDTEVL
jgi:hypothetical protein